MNLLHISVSLKNRNPNWDEMCFVKEKLLGDEMPAVQFHPPRSEYVNEHEHCLHIWASEDFSSCGAGWERKTTGGRNEQNKTFCRKHGCPDYA